MKKGTTLGKIENKNFILDMKERFRHQLIVGGSYNERSKLMINQISEDINNKHGIFITDTFGDLTDQILNKINNPKDVIIIDSLNSEYSFNIFENLNSTFELETLANLLMDNIEAYHLLEDGLGPHFKDFFITTIHSLNAIKSEIDFSLKNLNLFIKESKYIDIAITELRKNESENIDHIGFWKKYKERIQDNGDYAKEIIPYIEDKLLCITNNELLNELFSNKNPNLNADDILKNGKSVIFKINASEIGSKESKILGLFGLLPIIKSSFGRNILDFNLRIPYFIYIDNYSKYLSTPLMMLLGEGRKYNIGLVACQDYLNTITENQDYIKTIVGNFSNKAVFKGGSNKDLGIDINDSFLEENEFVFSYNNEMPKNYVIIKN